MFHLLSTRPFILLGPQCLFEWTKFLTFWVLSRFTKSTSEPKQWVCSSASSHRSENYKLVNQYSIKSSKSKEWDSYEFIFAVLSPSQLLESLVKDDCDLVDEIKAGRSDTPPRQNYYTPEDLGSWPTSSDTSPEQVPSTTWTRTYGLRSSTYRRGSQVDRSLNFLTVSIRIRVILLRA